MRTPARSFVMIMGCQLKSEDPPAHDAARLIIEWTTDL